MTEKDTGWEPKGTGMEYKGDEVWDHEIGPHQINDGDTEDESETLAERLADDE